MYKKQALIDAGVCIKKKEALIDAGVCIKKSALS